jgi:hypothetical protein
MRRIFIISIISLFFYSCNTDNCSDKLGFKLDYHLFDDIKMNGKSYCDLVNGALNGDKECVLELSKINVGDFASYQHGAVIIEVINKLTESEYLKIINRLDDKEKRAIYYSYVWAGLEFTPNPKFRKKHIEGAFPELTKQLK